MAKFVIREVEGMRQVRIDIEDESVRTVRGALSHMEGEIRMTAPVPSLPTLMKSMISKEALMRPRYRGTGTIFLQPSMRGFHIFEAREFTWILEPGVFWAAEGNVHLGLRMEKMIPSLRIGDGLIKFQSTLHGDGLIIINAPGPVEEIDIEDSDLLVKGGIVLGRTTGLRYGVRRAGSYIPSLMAGEPLAQNFNGKGKALVCWTPYWNQYIHDRMGPIEEPSQSLFE